MGVEAMEKCSSSKIKAKRGGMGGIIPYFSLTLLFNLPLTPPFDRIQREVRRRRYFLGHRAGQRRQVEVVASGELTIPGRQQQAPDVRHSCSVL